MRALKQTREVSSRLAVSFETLLAQFSATTLELNPSLGTEEFSRRLAVRAAEILHARAAVLVLSHGSGWETTALSGPAHQWDADIQRRLAFALAEKAAAPGVEFGTIPAKTALGPELAEALAWNEVILARLIGSEGTRMGVLCLVDVARELSAAETQLLQALASHASVALENARLFCRIERSRKQWVEDFDALSDWIVVHDSENRILRLNRALAGVLQMRPTEAIGRDMGGLELLGSPAVAGYCPFCRDSEGAHEEFIHEAAGQAYLISTSRIRSGPEDEPRTIHVLKNITEQRAAERRATNLQSQLMHTEKMAALGQLVSGVAHEVNNPLAAIVGFTDLMLESPEVPETAKDDLRIILQEAQRTRVIVKNLLSFARQMPPQREPLQMNFLLRQTLKLRAYDFSNHGVEVTERYEEELPLAVGDPHQLQQVFLNILNNAYDAVQETRRGRIEVETLHQGGQLEIRFRDNGPGIAQMERIFDPFFTTKEIGKGTGLGLSICYGIMRAHGGEITAQNNSDGPGCTFFVRLPVVAKEAECIPVEATL